jgi:hypothetical protein
MPNLLVQPENSGRHPKTSENDRLILTRLPEALLSISQKRLVLLRLVD